jgi:hypothetical protein
MTLAKHYELFDIQDGPFEDTWLMDDNRVLMTRLNATRKKECYKLEMTISETNIKDDTERPAYLNSIR